MPLSRSAKHLLISTVACGFVLWGAPAHAAAYYSSSSPLTAWEDGAAQAQGYGWMNRKDHTWLYNDTRHRDPRPGGDAAFHVTDYDLEVWNGQYGYQWKGFWYEDQSARTTSSSWYAQDDYYDYTSQAPNRGRIRAKVCEDQNNSPDPCSTRPFQTFDL